MLATGSYASRPVGVIKGYHETCKIKMFIDLPDDVPFNGCIDMSFGLQEYFEDKDGVTHAQIVDTAKAGKHMLICYRHELIMGVYFFEDQTPLPMNPVLYAKNQSRHNLGWISQMFCKYISGLYDEYKPILDTFDAWPVPSKRIPMHGR